MKRRIKYLERDLKTSQDSEVSLQIHLSEMKKQADSANDRALKAQDRVQVLQTFLDASLDSSPARQKQAQQEYSSYQNDKNNGDGDVRTPMRRTRDSQQSERSSSAEPRPSLTSPAAADLYSHIQDEARKLSMKSRARLLKMKELEDLSECNSVVSWSAASISSIQFPDPDLTIPSPAVVHDMQQKIDQEMIQLKQRKEKLRRTSASSAELSDSVRKYRSLLGQSSDDATESSDVTNKDKSAAASRSGTSQPEQQSRQVLFESPASTDDTKPRELPSESAAFSRGLPTSTETVASTQNDELVKLQTKLTEATREIQSLKNQIFEYQQQIADQEHAKEEADGKLQAKRTEASREILSLKNQIFDYQQQIADKEDAKEEVDSKLQAKLTEATREVISLKNQIFEYQQHIADEKDAREDLASQLDDAMSRQSDILQQLQTKETEKEELQSQLNTVKAEAGERETLLEDHVAQVEEEMRKLQSDMAALEEAKKVAENAARSVPETTSRGIEVESALRSIPEPDQQENTSTSRGIVHLEKDTSSHDEYISLQNVARGLNLEKEALEEQVDALREEIKQLEVYKEKATELEGALEDSKNERSSLQTELQALQLEKEALDGYLSELKDNDNVFCRAERKAGKHRKGEA